MAPLTVNNLSLIIQMLCSLTITNCDDQIVPVSGLYKTILGPVAIIVCFGKRKQHY